jgi:Tol biopolymer transport system component
MSPQQLADLIAYLKSTERPQPFPGRPVPGDTPVVFAPGDVSTDARELGIVFAADGRELYYTRVVDKLPILLRRRLVGSAWTAEERLALIAGQPDADHSDPAISPDGQRLYFVSGARTELFRPGGNIWMSRREGDTWGPAVLLPAPVNSDGGELYPIVVADGSLYFASNREGGFGEQDLYRAQYRDGRFVDAVNLGAAINTAQTEVDPYVSPDERTLIVAARRDGTRGALDLYASSRAAGGAWRPLVSLGDAINTDLTDYCPMMSPDGQYFFFSRRTAQGGDIYWVRASSVAALRP